MAISSVGSSLFNIDGITSGLKTSDIIDKLVSLEKGTLNALNTRKATIQTRDAAYQAIQAKVTTFQSAVSTLMLQSNVNVKSATSSAPTQVTASAGPDAAAGSFQVKVTHAATATSLNSASGLGPAINTGVAMNAAGFAVAPTSGTFTIDGVSLTINATDTLDSVIQAINNTNSDPDVTRRMNVVASAVTDASGRVVGLKLTSTTPGALVALGASEDTSNFLTATQLQGAPQVLDAGTGDYSVSSIGVLGGAITSSALTAANLAVTPALANGATSGTLTINGKDITWRPTDSLNDLISRINTAGAGVRAAYDPITDRLTLTNAATGAQAITLSEDANSNILEALGLNNASQKYGQVAQYQLSTDGGATFGPMRYSSSNTLSSVVPGVNLTLLADPGASPATTTITIAQDISTTQKNLQAFVDGFNGLVDTIDQAVQYDAKNKSASILTGDPSIMDLEAQIRSLVSDAPLDTTKSLGKYTSLASIGISTGAFGAALGSTNHLTLDQTKLTAALQDNPQAVQQLLNGLVSTATVTDGPTRWVASVSGRPSGQIYDATYALTYDPSNTNGNLSAVMTANGVTQPVVTGTILAGQANTSVISGLTITALPSLPAVATTGTTVQYTVQTRGVLQRLNDYLKRMIGGGGIFAAEKDSLNRENQALDAQIAHQNDLLGEKQAALQAQFTAMEVALSKLNAQSGSLASSLASLPTYNSSNSK